jgi:hypothetical protein
MQQQQQQNIYGVAPQQAMMSMPPLAFVAPSQHPSQPQLSQMSQMSQQQMSQQQQYMYMQQSSSGGYYTSLPMGSSSYDISSVDSMQQSRYNSAAVQQQHQILRQQQNALMPGAAMRDMSGGMDMGQQARYSNPGLPRPPSQSSMNMNMMRDPGPPLQNMNQRPPEGDVI